MFRKSDLIISLPTSHPSCTDYISGAPSSLRDNGGYRIPSVYKRPLLPSAQGRHELPPPRPLSRACPPAPPSAPKPRNRIPTTTVISAPRLLRRGCATPTSSAPSLCARTGGTGRITHPCPLCSGCAWTWRVRVHEAGVQKGTAGKTRAVASHAWRVQ